MSAPLDDLNVGEIFLSVAEQMKLYTEYCLNQEASSAGAAELKKNHTFVSLLEEAKANPMSNQLDLSAYLIKPFQRICSTWHLYTPLI
jgi:hypothetical protein